MSLKSYRELEVWNLAMEFVTRIYEVTKVFPKEELYGLTSQLRRATVSIPSNIAEGATRHSTKEFIRFLYISLGSSSEVDVQLKIARNLDYLSETLHMELAGMRDQIARMLHGLVASLKKRNRK